MRQLYKTVSKIAKFSSLKLEYIKFIDLNTTINMNSIIVSFTYIINLPTFFFFLKKFTFFYLFIYGCVGSSFLCEGFL